MLLKQFGNNQNIFALRKNQLFVIRNYLTFVYLPIIVSCFLSESWVNIGVSNDTVQA